MNMNEIGNDVAQYRERRWTHRALNARVYSDMRSYEKARKAKSEMAKTPRPSASGMHIQ